MTRTRDRILPSDRAGSRPGGSLAGSDHDVGPTQTTDSESVERLVTVTGTTLTRPGLPGRVTVTVVGLGLRRRVRRLELSQPTDRVRVLVWRLVAASMGEAGGAGDRD